MDMDFKQLAAQMFEAMKGVVGDNLEEVREQAGPKLEGFARRTASLAEKVADGRISASQATVILQMRQNAVETVLVSIAGLSLLAAQEAINAATGVLKNVINEAVPGVDIL